MEQEKINLWGYMVSYNSEIPIDSELKRMYKLTVDSYTGLGGFWDGQYLDKYQYEPNFKSRVCATEYLNQVKGIVDSITDPCFSDSIEREELNDYEEAFVNDCDNKGTSLTSFMNEVATWHTLLGNVFIIIDNGTDNTENTAEALAERKFPYIYYKIGTEVRDYKQDKHGKLLSISFYYETRKINGSTQKIYQHIDESEAYKYYCSGDKKIVVGEVLPSATNGLPVVQTGTSIMPVPEMLSLATSARLVYNKGSELREIERTTNINILQMVGRAPTKGKVAISNLVWVDKDATKDAKFISPDPNIMAGTLANVQSASNDLTNLGKSYGAIPITEQSQSGVAYAYEFMGNTETLSKKSLLFQDVEMRVFEKFALFFTWETKAVVKYDTEFTPSKSQLEKQYEWCERTLENDLSPTMNMICTLRMSVITLQLGGIASDEGEIRKIELEIEELTINDASNMEEEE